MRCVIVSMYGILLLTFIVSMNISCSASLPLSIPSQKTSIYKEVLLSPTQESKLQTLAATIVTPYRLGILATQDFNRIRGVFSDISIGMQELTQNMPPSTQKFTNTSVYKNILNVLFQRKDVAGFALIGEVSKKYAVGVTLKNQESEKFLKLVYTVVGSKELFLSFNCMLASQGSSFWQEIVHHAWFSDAFRTGYLGFSTGYNGLKNEPLYLSSISNNVAKDYCFPGAFFDRRVVIEGLTLDQRMKSLQEYAKSLGANSLAKVSLGSLLASSSFNEATLLELYANTQREHFFTVFLDRVKFLQGFTFNQSLFKTNYPSDIVIQTNS